ncbi:uncharacterized protein LOC134190038 isoform X2 [Corticium candelabrum]|uniref:uncharacterized protein LOC134190038 isoform X2 n=1 Tax=Corticium candelabrum TaxID=121492 RepID=UPI002E25610C|nr:uncharacterized protein LOC134190038 isoform X2 [Corticium candelabrum]
MASSGVYDDLLKSMGKGVEACDARKLPPKFRDIVSNLKKKAHAIARDSSSNALPDDHVNNFRDLLTKTTKKLNKLARVPSHNPDNLLFERLQTSLDDMGSLHFRVKSQDGVSVSIAGIITNSEAKKFWCDSFGSKEDQVDWEMWATAYRKKSYQLDKDSESIIRAFIAGGKFVAASKMNNACKTFGFPFKRVKCCREMECQCMEFKEKKWSVKRSSAGKEIETCLNCHHGKDRHYILEKLDEEPRSLERRNTGGSVKDKQLLIDKSTGLRPLQKSILRNNLDLARTIIKNATDIDERDDDGCTALHTAARFSGFDAVQLLLQHGASSKVFDKKGVAPVHVAARRGNLSALQALVSHDRSNAELKDQTESKATPLHHAAEENRTNVMEFLNSQYRANINATNSLGETAVFVAAACDNPEMITAAVELGADLTLRSDFDESAMDVAATEDSISCIVAIAQRAPETVTAVNDDGDPSLSCCFTGESVDMLVNLGADPCHKNEMGRTPLHAAATDPCRQEAARRLVSRGSEVDAKDKAGRTPLHVATSMDNTLGVNLLIDEAEANVNVRDNEGKSPLLVALDRNFVNLSENLLRKGADVHVSDVRGLTALHYASKNGYEKLSKMLLDAGVVVNAIDIEGKTPLHYAVVSNPHLAKLLVEEGADMYIRDARGSTALGLSRKSGHPLKHLTREEVEVLDFTEASKDELAVPPGPTCPSKCFADGPGLKGGYVDTRYSFSVFTCDENRKMQISGGAPLVIRIILAHTKASITATTGQPQQNDKRLMIRDNRDGTYSVAFELSNPGSHQFHISIARESVHGSPYVIPLQPFFAPAPPIISTTNFKPANYADEKIQFAKNEGIGQVDIAIVCDTTSSMAPEIKTAQKLMQDLIDSVNNESLCRELRLAVVAFRDHPPEDTTYVTRVWPLTSDISSVKAAVNSLTARGGGDIPEAVADALKEVVDLNWDETQRPHAVRMAVLIGDAPPHGMLCVKIGDNFWKGCPRGHDWLILAEQCRSKKINIYTVLCRNDRFAAQAFSAIAESSGGKCARIRSESDNAEIINLIKLHVHVQLDQQLTSSTVSDVIIRNPLAERTFEQRLVRVKEELSSSCFTVRRLQTGRGTATIQIRSVCEEDIYKAVEDFKLCERLANTKRDLTLMDHMGKKLYALRKIEGNLPSVAKTYNI